MRAIPADLECTPPTPVPPGPVLEIEAVIQLPPDERVRWGHLDSPRVDAVSDAYSLYVAGWVLGKTEPVVAVELVSGGITLCRTDVNVPRRDMVAVHPAAPGVAHCGFQAVLGAIRLPPHFEVLVQAVFQDGSSSPFRLIRGRRRPLRTDFEATLQPLLVTTLGRTGSSWLALLLAQHPRIISYRPFHLEPRVMSYWFDLVRVLAEPASYMQALSPDLTGEHWWIGDMRAEKQRRLSDVMGTLRDADPEVHRWLGRSHVEALISFAQGRLEAFYQEVARGRPDGDQRYFAEKLWPDHFIPRVVWELYPRAREIFLVRDFRDMVCSIFSFNQKNGYESFGRELTESDHEFVQQLRSSAAQMRDCWRARADRGFLLRYEDLIQEPRSTLRSVLDYLEIDSDNPTIETMLAGATATSPEIQRRHQTSMDPAASIGRWRRDLDGSLQEVCREAFGDILVDFGY